MDTFVTWKISTSDFHKVASVQVVLCRLIDQTYYSYLARGATLAQWLEVWRCMQEVQSSILTSQIDHITPS